MNERDKLGLPPKRLDNKSRKNFDGLVDRLSDEFGRPVRVAVGGFPVAARFTGTLTRIDYLPARREIEAKLGEVLFVHVEPNEPTDPPPISLSMDTFGDLPPEASGFTLQRDAFEHAIEIGADTEDNPLFVSIKAGTMHYTVTFMPRKPYGTSEDDGA